MCDDVDSAKKCFDQMLRSQKIKKNNLKRRQIFLRARAGAIFRDFQHLNFSFAFNCHRDLNFQLVKVNPTFRRDLLKVFQLASDLSKMPTLFFLHAVPLVQAELNSVFGN